MPEGIATQKITVALRSEQLHSIRRLVASGKTNSTSAFVRNAINIAPREWQTTLNDALQQTGGPLTDEERQWAAAILQPSKK